MLQVDTNVPVPEVGDDQVLVRVIYAGVNPVETYIREGEINFPHECAEVLMLVT